MDAPCSECNQSEILGFPETHLGLNEAAEKGHYSCLQALTREGVDVNSVDGNGNSPLIHAAGNGYDKCVRLLIQAGADVNAPGLGGETALFRAVKDCHDKCVILLVQAGADVNIIVNHETPLLQASLRFNYESVKLLTEAGADVNVRGKNGDTALMRAVCIGDENITNHFIRAGADVNISGNSGNTALMYSAKYGHIECMILLLKAGADVNASPVNPANRKDETALIRAAEGGHDKCLDLLIQAGADVNVAPVKGNTALITAILFRHYAIAKRLLKAGAQVTNQGDTRGVFTTLIRTSQTGSAANLRLLIEAGADVNLTDSKGNTALITVAGSKSLNTYSCIQMLLKVGAEINKINIYDQNALRCHVAKFKWINKRVVMLLFSAGEIGGKTVQRYSIYGDTFLTEMPEFLQQPELKLCLKHVCREAIRKHLIDLNPHLHLFNRVRQLGLPSSLASHLLYYTSLEE